MVIHSLVVHVGQFCICPGWENESILGDVVGVLDDDLFGFTFPMLVAFALFALDPFAEVLLHEVNVLLAYVDLTGRLAPTRTFACDP